MSTDHQFSVSDCICTRFIREEDFRCTMPGVPVRNFRAVLIAAVFILSSFSLSHAQENGRNTDIPVITRDEDRYSCSIRKAPPADVINILFTRGGREYALISRPSMNLENLTYSDKAFDTLLELILFQCNCDYTVKDGVYYIYEVQKKDAVKKLKETKIIQIQNMSLDALAALFPNELNAAAFIKQDKSSNSVILTGSPSEITPIEEFIREIDVPDGRSRNRSVRLKYIKSDELMKNLPP